MVHTVVDGTFRQTNLTNESSEYLAKREELRLAEIELMRQRERVAELRRNLPEGSAIQDYQFEEGPRDVNARDAPVRTVRLSELFTKPNRSLVIYHFMFGKAQTKACPMCTAWLDGANGVAHHLNHCALTDDFDSPFTARFGGTHRAGCQVVFADGSVRLISAKMSEAEWGRLVVLADEAAKE